MRAPLSSEPEDPPFKVEVRSGCGGHEGVVQVGSSSAGDRGHPDWGQEEVLAVHTSVLGGLAQTFRRAFPHKTLTHRSGACPTSYLTVSDMKTVEEEEVSGAGPSTVIGRGVMLLGTVEWGCREAQSLLWMPL